MPNGPRQGHSADLQVWGKIPPHIGQTRPNITKAATTSSTLVSHVATLNPVASPLARRMGCIKNCAARLENARCEWAKSPCPT
eukprot:5131102-Alexandrium_andersonii.AAC.1